MGDCDGAERHRHAQTEGKVIPKYKVFSGEIMLTCVCVKQHILRSRAFEP